MVQVFSEMADNVSNSALNLLHHANKNLKKLPMMAIMTISLSSSCMNFLTQALTENPNITLIVCESRPLYEGVTAAEKCSQVGHNVVVITEAQAASFIASVDMVLVGADSLTKRGIVNKV